MRRALCLLPLAAVLSVAAAPVPAELPNPGFEAATGTTADTWAPFGKGYSLDRDTRHSGGLSARLVTERSDEAAGLAHTVVYETPDRRPIVVGGWSKAENVAGGGDYCVYLDVIYEDGSPLWGLTAGWPTGTHDWAYTAKVYYPEKPVREIRTHVLLRGPVGTAWVDDVIVARGGLHLLDPNVISDYPRSPTVSVRAGLTESARWTCTLGTPTIPTGTVNTGTGTDVTAVWGDAPDSGDIVCRIVVENDAGLTLRHREILAVPRPPANPIVEGGFRAWAVPGTVKVYPDSLPPRGVPGDVALEAARGGHDGFQIAVKGAAGVTLETVRLTVSAPTASDGAVIAADCVSVAAVGNIRVRTPSGHPLAPNRPNWCPDVLFPTDRMRIPAPCTGAFAIDVSVPRDAAPGLYRGTVRVEAGGHPSQAVPFALRVHPVTLPPGARMRTAFCMMEGFLRQRYGTVTPELRRAFADVMLDHRLNPDDISRTQPPEIAELLHARERGMNAFNVLNLVPEPKGDPTWVCYVGVDDYPEDFCDRLAERLDPVMADIERHGLTDLAYVYGFDERGPEYDPLIRRICAFVKQRYPGLRTFTTAGYMYDRHREAVQQDDDGMDWYCPLTSRYDADLSRRLREHGKQVWWYVCCGPKYPYANFASVDYPLIEGRLLAWMTFLFEADGLLYWHVNYWDRIPVLSGLDDPFLPDVELPCIDGMTGDGVLIYPGADGPIPSLRLRAVRDGLEDFDLLAMLAERRGRDTAAALGARLVRSLTDYERDPQALREVRAELLRALAAKTP